MDKNHFKYALFNLVQAKLQMNTLPQQLANQTILLYNSINPELFRGKKISEVLPAVATVIADRIKNNNLGIREGLNGSNKQQSSSNEPKKRTGKELTKHINPEDRRNHAKSNQHVDEERVANGNVDHNIGINAIRDRRRKLGLVKDERKVKSKDNTAERRAPRNAVEAYDPPAKSGLAYDEIRASTYISNMTRDELVEEKGLLDAQMREINARLSLPVVVAGEDLPPPELEEPEDIRDTMKTLLNINAETENDKYMAASFVINENRELTQFEKSDIQINSFLGVNDLSTLQMLFNPESLYVRYYVVMDSDYRVQDSSTNNISRFKWNYTDSLNLQDGFVNSDGNIHDVIGMRLYQPRIPYSAAMVTTAKRVSVLIEEFGSQAFIGENGRRFHFLMRPNFDPTFPAPSSIEISTEDYNDGLFHFRKPITTFDSLTVSFGDPLDIIEFTAPFDRFFIAIEFTCYKSDK